VDQEGEAVVSVVTSVAPLAKALSYRVPTDFVGPTDVGARVSIPLHGRTVTGWIVPEHGALERDRASLKFITRSQGYGPPPSVVELCRYASWRWAGSLAHFLAAASPSTIVREIPIVPAQPAIEGPDSELGTLFSVTDPGMPVLVELGPAHDPFDLILGAVASCAQTQGSLLIVVPSKAYARRLTGRLARRRVRCVDLSDAWDAARAGWPVVVGTRNAAFAPVPMLAGVIVLDAEDPALVSSAAPTFSAVDVLAERTARSMVPMLAVSAVPHAQVLGGATPLVIGSPPEREGWAVPIVVNRKGDDPRLGWISQELVTAAREALEAQASGVAGCCVINRKGRAKLLVCKRCDSVARCGSCDAAVSLGEELRCPRCATTRPSICLGCGSMSFKQLRPGTQRLAEELGALLGVACVEVTADSKEVDANARFYVGTEAALYRIRETSLVAFVDIDHHLLAARAGAEIDALRLLARASRLVGGRGPRRRGQVLIQTRLEQHRVLDAVRQGDPSLVLGADRELREQLGLPPFRAMAAISGAGEAELSESLESHGATVIALESHSVVVAENHQILCDLFETVGRPKSRVRIAIDPEGL